VGDVSKRRQDVRNSAGTLQKKDFNLRYQKDGGECTHWDELNDRPGACDRQHLLTLSTVGAGFLEKVYSL